MLIPDVMIRLVLSLRGTNPTAKLETIGSATVPDYLGTNDSTGAGAWVAC